MVIEFLSASGIAQQRPRFLLTPILTLQHARLTLIFIGYCCRYEDACGYESDG